MSRGRKIVVAITGASGSIYAKRLLDYLQQISKQYDRVDLVFSKNAKEVWRHELGGESYNDFSFKEYEPNDFYAPFASGSAGYDTMIVCPCSMGTLGRIAHGVSDDLITRAADVILKEKRKLIVVPRETPYSLIHIENMKIITLAGGIICPATPSFYSNPKSIEEVVETVVERILNLADFNVDSFQWGEQN